MRNLIVTAALLLATGCGGGSSDAAAPKASPSPVVKVSLQTTCDRVFSQGPGEMGLWGQATDLVQVRANGETWDEAQASDTHDRLKEIAASSEASIRPHLEAMAEAMDSETDLDIAGYKASGTEVANMCSGYVAS